MDTLIGLILLGGLTCVVIYWGIKSRNG